MYRLALMTVFVFLAIPGFAMDFDCLGGKIRNVSGQTMYCIGDTNGRWVFYEVPDGGFTGFDDIDWCTTTPPSVCGGVRYFPLTTAGYKIRSGGLTCFYKCTKDTVITPPAPGGIAPQPMEIKCWLANMPYVGVTAAQMNTDGSGVCYGPPTENDAPLPPGCPPPGNTNPGITNPGSTILPEDGSEPEFAIPLGDDSDNGAEFTMTPDEW